MYMYTNNNHCVCFFFKCVGIYTVLIQEATIFYRLLQSDSLQPFNVTKMNALVLLLLLVELASSVSICSNTDSAVISLYKDTCCKTYNNGKAIKFRDDRLAVFFCPQNVEELCSPRSCKEVLHLNPNASSGYYYITLSNGSTGYIFCDMEGLNCDQQGGWTRIAYLNMTKPGAICPEGLRARNYINLDHQLCSKIGDEGGCSSVYYSSLANYTKLCGQVRGYQYGSPDGVGPKLGSGINPNTEIDQVYVDGVSIMETILVNIYGHTLEVGMNRPALSILTYVLVIQNIISSSYHQRLLDMTITVNLETLILIRGTSPLYFPMILFGMVNSVVSRKCLVVTVHQCHGSQRL